MNDAERELCRANYGRAVAAQLEKAEQLLIVGITVTGIGAVHVLHSATPNILGGQLPRADGLSFLMGAWQVIGLAAMVRLIGVSHAMRDLRQLSTSASVSRSFAAGVGFNNYLGTMPILIAIASVALVLRAGGAEGGWWWLSAMPSVGAVVLGNVACFTLSRGTRAVRTADAFARTEEEPATEV